MHPTSGTVEWTVRAKLPADAPPELRAYAKQLAKRERAERLALRAMIGFARENECTLYQAAHRLTDGLSKKKRAEALDALYRLAERHARKAYDRAMSPRKRRKDRR